MKRVIYANGSGVAFVHNHPSGDPTPSVEDHELTERLRQASAILGIRMLDHLVVAFEGWRSIVSGASGSWPTASEAA
jgi:DNA repair protein RadC